MLVEGLGKGIDMIFEGWKLIFGLIGDALGPAIDWVKDKLDNTDWVGIKDMIINLFNRVIGLPKFLKQKILDFFGIKESELSAKDKAATLAAEQGAHGDKAERMMGDKARAEHFRSQQIAAAVKTENAMSDARQREIEKTLKTLESIDDKVGMPTVIPGPNDPPAPTGREIGVTDVETAILGNNLFAAGL
jgi:hypothetical protein